MMTHWHVCHDCSWLIHMCAMTFEWGIFLGDDMWHDICLCDVMHACVTWLIHLCHDVWMGNVFGWWYVSWHVYMWHDACMCAMTPSFMPWTFDGECSWVMISDVAFVRSWHTYHIWICQIYIYMYVYVYIYIYKSSMRHEFSVGTSFGWWYWDITYAYATWRIHRCAMTHTYIWMYIYICKYIKICINIYTYTQPYTYISSMCDEFSVGTSCELWYGTWHMHVSW